MAGAGRGSGQALASLAGAWEEEMRRTQHPRAFCFDPGGAVEDIHEP